MQTYRNVTIKTLPDGNQVDNYSKEWMLYCEALSLSKKSYSKRVDFLDKLKDLERTNKIKYYLQLIWDLKKRDYERSKTQNQELFPPN